MKPTSNPGDSLTSPKRLISTSKFLSLVLRHRPDAIGATLDGEGWLEIESLIELATRSGRNLDLALLHEVVSNNDKQRFALSDDGLRIRANQGHSLSEVNLKLESVPPPANLFHGTVPDFLPGIRESGLLKRTRHHVHLSADAETATRVGSRRGKPVILKIAADKMHVAGFLFFQSANEVWLTDQVPVEFVEFPAGYLS